jgi:hypothetical protein
MTTHPNGRSLPRSLAVLTLSSIWLVACGSSDGDDAAGATADGDAATVRDGEVNEGGNAAPVTTALPDVNILTDFADVCRGTSLPGATPYDPARSGVHPVRYAIGEHPSYDDVIASMPTQWDPVTGQEFTTELVACIARTTATPVQTCEGYEDDGQATGNVVELYDATYDVRLLAATTGDEIATTTIEATSGDCPMLFFFDPDENVGIDHADPGDQLTAWMAPYVET